VYHNDIRKKARCSKDEEYNTVSIGYTKKTVTTSKMSEAKDQIAIIYAQGEIQGGEGDVNAEGSMRRSLQEARKK
jgi:protease-4